MDVVIGKLRMATASLPGDLSDGDLHRLEQRVCDAIRMAMVMDHELLPSLRDMKKALTELKERRAGARTEAMQ